ncbi:(2Fe-2S)-binding protein [Negadavirga shengliensis]|uniref:(2Fe-2S)-binding protein n=1 Tax=Negadavirga shengliensis TaxID=1389218 RepID=A0ABV9T473_9BACT
MKNEIQLTVNGQRQRVAVAPDTPLLYVLRNNLELNGPKYGCGLEQCGSCMVLIDGEARPSCLVPVSSLQDAVITTLDGLGNAQTLHPVQEAFVEEQAAQCGYCLNGMVMATAGLLEKNTDPREEDIRQALQGVVCRCGTHSRVLKAARKAVQLAKK